MSNNGVFRDSCSESVHVIGYLPTKFDPFIPDAVLTEQNGTVMMLFKDRSVKICTDAERSAAIKTSLRLGCEEWIVIDGDPKPMLLSDMGGWRDRIAVKVVQKAMEIKGEPLRVLNMVESAAKLKSLDLAGFVSTLSTQRANEGENLEAVFLRVRGTRAGGQRGE